MSEQPGRTYRSLDVMGTLEEAALLTHVENFDAPEGISRRRLLKLMMGAPAALALGVPGCARKPRRKIISRVDGPEYQKPGKPLYYASTWTDGSFPYGLLIKTVDGRPIKIEGDPDHPVNRGSTTAAMQASILSLYDPDRLRRPQLDGRDISWADADKQAIASIENAKSVVLLTRSTLGPAERALLDRFLAACPQARHFVHETAHDGPRRSAWRKVYGIEGELLPRFDRARVILSLDCDFLGTDGAVIENIRTFAEGRRLDDANHQHATMNRLYVAEGAMTLTGSNADQRIGLRPSALGSLASALRASLTGDRAVLATFAKRHHVELELLEALADDLQSNPGTALVVAGGHLPESVHAAVALLNDELASTARSVASPRRDVEADASDGGLNKPHEVGGGGKTLEWNPTPATLRVSDPLDIEAALDQGVDVLICLGVNPVYDWPGGGFERFLKKAEVSIGHGSHVDETLAACTLALPSSHNLESWNDAEPREGLKTLCQPVIAPLNGSRQEAESLLVWTQARLPKGDPIRAFDDWHGYLQDRWQRRLVPDAAEGIDRLRKTAWEDALRAGGQFDANAAALPALERVVAEDLARASRKLGPHSGPYTERTELASGHELVILPHHALHDGRYANNGWLHELPDPVSKLVWDSALSMSPRLATELGVLEGDLVKVSVEGRVVELPALVQPGMAEGVLAATLGYGRTAGGYIVDQASGTNVAPLVGRLGAATPRLALDVKVRKSAGSRKLVRTQKQFSMHDRPIVLDGDLDEYRHQADFVKHKRHLPAAADLYESYDYSKGHKWGMAIDLGSCVGCSGCVTACQAENNIPIVGRDECDNGREMHWLRIDRYHDGDTDNPKVHHQPMLCQHCDNAPCENVCPVNATTHSPEGLNEMVYNRCVGTRYCGNNCPYKVRRFNFLRYQQKQLRDPVQELVFNPQVTVRGVGVMEKCTFCVQRINAVKFEAANKGEPMLEGALQTACQQACPAKAIVFGDMNDPDSEISKMRASARSFHVLEELNVKPNVTYLARVRNPIAGALAAGTESTGSHRG